MPEVDAAIGKLTGSLEPRPWHAWPEDKAVLVLGVDPRLGLEPDEASTRLRRFGPNRLAEPGREAAWKEFLEELAEPMILLLLATGVLYSLWGRLEDGLTIFGIIIALVSAEVWNERRAKKAIAGLRELAEPVALVRRGARQRAIPVREVVPGDIALLRAGQYVPADGRLLEAFGLATDESGLTGESVPTEKEAQVALVENTPLAARRNMVFAGTIVRRGRGVALIVTTGMATELGHVAALALEVREPRTPLQEAMAGLSKGLMWIALGFSAAVPLLGWLLSRQPVREMLLVGLSLAFATIPEEMPIIITMVLALGAYRLSRQRAVVKHLSAVEVLGAVTVIAMDKTGTLTQNRLEVQSLFPEAQAARLLELGVLSAGQSAETAPDEPAGPVDGDPVDRALLGAARGAGIDVATLSRAHPLRSEYTFDNVRRRMSSVHGAGDQLLVVVKGAPEAVLERCTHTRVDGAEHEMDEAQRTATLATAAAMAGAGLRVLAFAEKAASRHMPTQEDAESGLQFVGLVGLADALRQEARATIAACLVAGIRPIMVSGDHLLTALAVAQAVELPLGERQLTGPDLDTLTEEELREAVGHVNLYARATPEHKLRIVQALRERGERVAVTGDGINDAPALVAADVGVAMGETGTDVARQAADLVVLDDNLATIVRAVGEGRVVFANLVKCVRYYLACKVALVLAMLIPVLLRVPAPFAPVQVVLMELLMDLGASGAFVAEPTEAGLMARAPRDPRTPFMNRKMVVSTVSAGLGLCVGVVAAHLLVWYGTRDAALSRTTAFAAWLLGHVLLALSLRSESEPLWRTGLRRNWAMAGWGAAAAAFAAVSILVPWVGAVLKTVPLPAREWCVAIGGASAGALCVELRKLAAQRAASGAPRHDRSCT